MNYPKQLECSICFNIVGSYGPPVTTDCGHSFCEVCLQKKFGTDIDNYVDTGNTKNGVINKCPTCMTQINSITVNFMLKELVEEFLPLDDVVSCEKCNNCSGSSRLINLCKTCYKLQLNYSKSNLRSHIEIEERKKRIKFNKMMHNLALL